ncbi:hypothetical protein OHA25_08680 [Nonomuraea sp. NBC_00507]|uniref:hypothetical protein n=1 Tax=Nonomuraea sp. NBC_00507 TaxID=2976002 RepID=UPI002E17E794
MTARDPRNDAFRPPPPSWPDLLSTARLARLWGMHCRLVSVLITNGLLDGRLGPTGRHEVSREAAEAFARDAIRVREVTAGITIRHPRWARGRPLRVVENALVENGTRWQLGLRTEGGQLVYQSPCPGDRIVLRAPQTPLSLETPVKDLDQHEPA